jgi:hypothetical protein
MPLSLCSLVRLFPLYSQPLVSRDSRLLRLRHQQPLFLRDKPDTLILSREPFHRFCLATTICRLSALNELSFQMSLSISSPIVKLVCPVLRSIFRFFELLL